MRLSSALLNIILRITFYTFELIKITQGDNMHNPNETYDSANSYKVENIEGFEIKSSGVPLSNNPSIQPTGQNNPPADLEQKIDLNFFEKRFVELNCMVKRSLSHERVRNLKDAELAIKHFETMVGEILQSTSVENHVVHAKLNQIKPQIQELRRYVHSAIADVRLEKNEYQGASQRYILAIKMLKDAIQTYTQDKTSPTEYLTKLGILGDSYYNLAYCRKKQGNKIKALKAYKHAITAYESRLKQYQDMVKEKSLALDAKKEMEYQKDINLTMNKKLALGSIEDSTNNKRSAENTVDNESYSKKRKNDNKYDLQQNPTNESTSPGRFFNPPVPIPCSISTSFTPSKEKTEWAELRECANKVSSATSQVVADIKAKKVREVTQLINDLKADNEKVNKIVEIFRNKYPTFNFSSFLNFDLIKNKMSKFFSDNNLLNKTLNELEDVSKEAKELNYQLKGFLHLISRLYCSKLIIELIQQKQILQQQLKAMTGKSGPIIESLSMTTLMKKSYDDLVNLYKLIKNSKIELETQLSNLKEKNAILEYLSPRKVQLKDLDELDDDAFQLRL